MSPASRTCSCLVKAQLEAGLALSLVHLWVAYSCECKVSGALGERRLAEAVGSMNRGWSELRLATDHIQ